ncbi:MAG: M28 family metallopeptidase [Oscillospiraceae bacterium]|jgi:hypothetical protein
MIQLSNDALKYLCVDRSVGSAGEKRFLGYIKRKTAELGIQPEQDSFSFCAAILESAQLQFGAEIISCNAYPCTRITEEDGLSGKLLYIPRISEVRYLDIERAIVLTDDEFNDYSKELLSAGGAAGVITHREDRLQQGASSVRFLPQEPSSDTLTAIELQTSDALRLLRSKVENVQILTRARKQIFSAENLCALLPGQDHSREIVICAHYDTVPLTAGAVDNLSGSLILLYLLDMLISKTPRTDIRFCWFGAEEWGYAGSRHYVSKADALVNKISCAINIDSADCILGFDELYYCCSNSSCLEQLSIPATGLRTLEQVYGGDNRPFQEIGIDTLTFSRGGKYIRTLIHTKNDTLENAVITDSSLRFAAQRILRIISPLIYG